MPRIRTLLRCTATLLCLLTCLAACSALSVSARADEEDAASDGDGYTFEEADEPQRRRTARSESSDETPHDDDRGVNVRTGHLAFETFGRHESLTNIEFFPYLIDDDEVIFGDVRLFVTNMGEFGANAGFGYRHLLSGWDQVIGANVFYDGDSSTGELFHQVGVGLETFGDVWDLRSNVYVPIVDTEHVFAERLFNQRFDGNGILFDHSRRFGEALPGLDLEAGLRLPGDFSRDHNLRVFAGWYFFAGDDVDNINGFKSRVEGDLWAGFSSQVEFTTDDTFGTNVMLGVAWQYDNGYRYEHRGDPARARLTEYVRRNYNVIVSEQRTVSQGLTAINPITGQPYVVQHVNSAAGGAQTGAANDPFATITQAQAAGGDIIFVQSGSVLTAPVVLQAGERLLGEGIQHFVDVAGYGSVLMPGAVGGARPTLQGAVGDGVTLASNTELSGFIIDGPTGNGITGIGVGNVTIRGLDVLNAGGAGLFLQNSSGPVSVIAARIDGSTGPAFHVDGGAADILFSGTIDNGSDYALLVENTTGGTVDLSFAEINDDGGQGLLIDNADSDVLLGEATIANSTGAGIEIRDSGGDVGIVTATITDAAGPGILLSNNTGLVAFGVADVTASNGAAGVDIQTNPGDVFFNALLIDNSNGAGLVAADSGQITINDGTIATVGGSAVDIDNAELAITLQSLSADGAQYGLSLVDTTGAFVVNGNGGMGTGGLIENSVLAAVRLDNAGTVGLQYMDLEANQVGLLATDTDRIALSRVRVTNSLGAAIDATNTGSLEVANSTFTGNGTLGTGSILVSADAVETYAFSFTGSTVTDNVADAITVQTLAGGENSTMNLWIMDSGVTHNGAASTGLNVAWDGTLTSQIGRSSFGSTGLGSTGIAIDALSTTRLAQIAIGNNAFTYSGINSIATDITTANDANIVIGTNLVNLNGAGGTGFRFDLAADAEVQLASNIINDNVSGATGILFTSIDGPSEVTINNNTINLFGPAGPVDRGIIFSSVGGTIQLFGTQNNRVNGATTPFSAPPGSTTGRIIVNGTPVP